MPRGVAKALPTPYEPTEEEMEEMRKTAEELGEHADDEDEWEDVEDDEDEGMSGSKKTEKSGKKAAKHARAAANAAMNADDDDLAEYNLDAYDDEPNAAFVSGLAMFSSNTEDPYVTLPDADDDSGADEDNMILPTDDIILTCHSTEEGHTLEVYVYDQNQGSLFVHHDLMLNAFPLCVTWLSCARKEGSTGSFAAIGTMDPEIEVWDLDCIDRQVSFLICVCTLCMFVCMHACMHVCIYVCVYIYIYIQMQETYSRSQTCMHALRIDLYEHAHPPTYTT
jgi:periodic tryptophan protein 1